MKALKYIITTLIMLIGMNAAFPQLSEHIGKDSLVNDYDLILNQDIQGFTNDNSTAKIENPLRMNYFAGTDLSYSSLFGYGQGINLGANGSYALNSRFRMSVGSYVRFSRLSNVPSVFNSESGFPSTGFTSTLFGFYARGDYFLTPRLIVSGTLFKEFSPFSGQAVNPLFLNHNREGMSLQFNYKLLNNLHIGAQFNYIKTDNPYHPYGVNRSVYDNYYW